MSAENQQQKRWLVTTTATVSRTYEVEADDEKIAAAKSCDQSPVHEEDVHEEIVAVQAIETPAHIHGNKS